MKKIIQINLVAVFYLFTYNAYSQKENLGKVTIVELQEKVHPLDPSAAAAFLFQEGESRVEYDQNEGFIVITNVKTKIKIYKKEGFQWATESVMFNIQPNFTEKLTFSNEVTYNLENGKIEKTKLKSDGEFVEKVNMYWNRKKIVMPNVKEGSIVEFEYTLRSPISSKFKDWDFQYTIPVNYSEYRTYIPEYFTYKPNQKGYFFPKVTSEKNTKTIVETENSRNMIRTNFSTSKTNYLETKTTYVAENVPALKDEDFVNNIKNYSSSINLELSVINYPNSTPKYFSADWESVVKSIYENEDFGGELNKSGYFEDDINSILSKYTSEKERIFAIFNFVKSKLNWNGYYGYSCDNGVKKAYKENVGNVAEINLMLTAMLRFAKIEANPVLVSTRSNGISISPSRTSFNYVICAVEIENGLILLDATDKFTLPNILPIRAINWVGRLIRNNKSSTIVNLTPRFNSKDVITLMANIDTEGKIEGKVRRQFTEYNAFVFRENYTKIDEKVYVEKLENERGGIDISDYSIENVLDLSKPITQTYSFLDENRIEIIGNKMYFSPMLFYANTENPFKSEKREYPIDFSFPYTDKYTFNFQIPDGYAIESVPESLNLEIGYNLGGFKYIVSPLDNKIQVAISHDINVSIINPEYYDLIKGFYQKMIEKQNEKIVLKRI